MAKQVVYAQAGMQHPKLLRFFGHFISFIFHPLFIPSYVIAFLLFIHPYAYAGMDETKKPLKFLFLFFNTAFLPAFSVLLMKLLGFVQSIFLRSQRDRIIPYIVSMIFYFWAWYVAKNQPDNPSALVVFLLATFLASIAGLMANIYFKISMHGMAVGALLAFFIWLALGSSLLSLGFYLAMATLVTGLVCTARMLVSDHNAFEVYIGVLAGVICVLISIPIAG